MTQDPQQNTMLQAIIEKRQSLQEQIVQLTELAEETIEHGSATADVEDRIGTILAAAHAELTELLAIKEDGRFFQDIVDGAFRLQSAVSQLREDHTRLLADLDELREDASHSDRLPHVHRRLRGWLTRFKELDLREIELIQEIWNVDVGNLD